MSEISWYKAANFEVSFLFAVSTIKWKQANVTPRQQATEADEAV